MQSSAGPTPSTTMAQQPPQGVPYDTQYYYTAPPQYAQPAPPQPQPQYIQQYQDNGYLAPAQMAPQPAQYYTPYTAGPPQPIIYYQQPAPMYYPIPPQQTGQIMAHGDIMQQQQTQLQPQMQQPPHISNELNNQRGPLTSSTPIPSRMEYENAQREMAQREMAAAAARPKMIQFRYNYKPMEHDDDYDHMLPIDEISKITIDHANDDTMSADKENLAMDQRSDKLISSSSSRRNPFGSGDSQQAQAQTPTQQQQQQQPMNYKTRLCMMHAAGTRPCEMGSRCKFAHGLKELRTAEVPNRFPNNKYKTKLCKNFARGGTGFCPYGLRCEFVHPTDKEFQTIPIYQRMLVDDRVLDAADMSSELEDYPPQQQQQHYYHHQSSHHLNQQQPQQDHFQSTKRYLQNMAKRGGMEKHGGHPSKTLLKHRNVVGSMMCLSQTGRIQESNSMAGGDFNNTKTNGSFDQLPPHMRSRTSSKVSMGSSGHLLSSKQSRRQSLSQLKTRWTSEEHLTASNRQ